MKKLLVLILLWGCNKSDIPTPIVPTQQPVLVELKSISLEKRIDTLVISKNFKYVVKGTYSNNTTKDLSDSIIVSNNNDKTTVKNNIVYGAKSGTTIINISYKNFIERDTATIYEIESVDIDGDLKARTQSKIVVPVIVINYFPTVDGINLDMIRAPDDYWQYNNSTLDLVKNKTKRDLVITKNGIEEGTRFRDYGKGTIQNYAGIEVVKYFNVYEADYVDWFVDGTKKFKTFDNTKLFNKLGIKDYIENKGVKEIWITMFPVDGFPSVVNAGNNDPNNYFGVPESMMSSPITGNISNPFPRANVLPLYNKTYVVYGNSGSRSVAENLHNRGHEIEVEMNYIEKNKVTGQRLFYDLFAGWGNKTIPSGSCGMTHFPPNALSDYDYSQTKPIPSDIMDRKPDGSGVKKDYTYLTHMNVKYGFDMVNTYRKPVTDFGKDPQAMWMIFWFQSIPGMNNGLTYNRNGNSYKLENWWDIFWNWDDANKSGKTLWIQ
jgi:hypothetical protein